MGQTRFDWNDPNLGKVEIDDFLGHEYIAMQWKDRKYFFKAMEAFLRNGIPIMTQSRLCVNFSSKNLPKDVEFTPEVAEQMHLEDLSDPIEGKSYRSYLRHWPYKHSSSWSTDAGRSIVRLILSDLRENEVESDDETCSIDRLENLERDLPPPEDECLVCMDSRPDTQVEPCGHQAVCSNCFDKLKRTADEFVCIRCRRPITSVVKL